MAATAPSGALWLTPFHDVAPQETRSWFVSVTTTFAVPLAGATLCQSSVRNGPAPVALPVLCDEPTKVSACPPYVTVDTVVVALVFNVKETPTSNNRFWPTPTVWDHVVGLVVPAMHPELASSVTTNGSGVAVAVAVAVGVLVGVAVPSGAARRTAATSAQPRVAPSDHDIVTEPVLVVFTLLAPRGMFALTTFHSALCEPP